MNSNEKKIKFKKISITVILYYKKEKEKREDFKDNCCCLLLLFILWNGEVVERIEFWKRVRE